MTTTDGLIIRKFINCILKPPCLLCGTDKVVHPCVGKCLCLGEQHNTQLIESAFKELVSPHNTECTNFSYTLSCPVDDALHRSPCFRHIICGGALLNITTIFAHEFIRSDTRQVPQCFGWDTRGEAPALRNNTKFPAPVPILVSATIELNSQAIIASVCDRCTRAQLVNSFQQRVLQGGHQLCYTCCCEGDSTIDFAAPSLISTSSGRWLCRRR